MRKSFYHFDEENLDQWVEYLEVIRGDEEEYRIRWDDVDSGVIGGSYHWFRYPWVKEK